MYGVTVHWGGQVPTSVYVPAETIANSLDNIDDDAAKQHAAAVRRLMADGCRYAGEDYDVLALAWNAFLDLRRTS